MGASANNGYPDFYDEKAGYFDDGKDLRVTVEDFNSFSTSVRLEMNNFTTNWNNAISPLMMTCSVAFGNDSDFKEAKWAQVHHRGTMDGAGQLMADIMLGFQAISTAAMTIGVEYKNGDLEGAEAMDAISETFYPPNGANSLEKMREQAEEGDKNKGDEPPKTTATEAGDETSNPYDESRPYRDVDGTTTYPDRTPEDQPTDAGRGNGKVTIPADPYTDVPELKYGAKLSGGNMGDMQ